MKLKLNLAILALSALGASAAYADQIGLTYLDTNNYDYCQQVANEVNLLSNANATVSAYCATDIVPNYAYTLVTTISTDYSIVPGSVIQLANLDSNEPTQLMTDLGYLTHAPAAGSGRYALTLNLMGPSTFVSDQGNEYAYRIQVGVAIN